MTHQPPSAEFAIVDQGVSAEQLGMARVQFIESFARLEGTIARIIVQHDAFFDLRAPFGNKLKALSQIKTPPLTKKAFERFAKIGSELATLAKIRNDLVHGLMSVVTHESVVKGAFQNVADLAVNLPQFTMLSVDDFEVGHKKLRHIANELKQLANPPSPPQPSPGAAAGL